LAYGYENNAFDYVDFQFRQYEMQSGNDVVVIFSYGHNKWIIGLNEWWSAKQRRCYPNNNVGIYPDGEECRISHNAVSVSLPMGNRYTVQW